MRLEDRVAIVTGAASGIGAASALAMAAEGARVLVVDLNECGAKATVERIEKAGGQAAAARADVTRAADSQAIVEQAGHALGAAGHLLRQRRRAAVEDRRRGRRGEDLRPDHGGQRQGRVPRAPSTRCP